MTNRCYIASPFFDKEGAGIREIELIKKVLQDFNIKFFSPKDNNFISSGAEWSERQKGFDRNIREIERCDFMIANTRDKDIGVCIEIGFSRAMKKPVILFTPQIKGFSINLMLAQLVIGFAFDEQELRARINEYLHGYLSPDFRGEVE